MSTSVPSPAMVVQRQLEAFNARDPEALLACYATDAELHQHPGALLRRGIDELRTHFTARLADPILQTALLHRALLGDLVVDHERVTRTFPEGAGTIELVMTYEIRAGRIARAWSSAGPVRLTPPAAANPLHGLFVSPYEKTGGMVWFPRLLRKIRLHAENRLPADFVPYLGRGFDQRCANFLGVDYAALAERVRAGGSDDELLAWCHVHGRKPSDDEVRLWNDFMIKRGWRDTDAPDYDLQNHKNEYGLGHRTDILTYFDFYEVDEGRRP